MLWDICTFHASSSTSCVVIKMCTVLYYGIVSTLIQPSGLPHTPPQNQVQLHIHKPSLPSPLLPYKVFAYSPTLIPIDATGKYFLFPFKFLLCLKEKCNTSNKRLNISGILSLYWSRLYVQLFSTIKNTDAFFSNIWHEILYICTELSGRSQVSPACTIEGVACV